MSIYVDLHSLFQAGTLLGRQHDFMKLAEAVDQIANKWQWPTQEDIRAYVPVDPYSINAERLVERLTEAGFVPRTIPFNDCKISDMAGKWQTKREREFPNRYSVVPYILWDIARNPNDDGHILIVSHYYEFVPFLDSMTEHVVGMAFYEGMLTDYRWKECDRSRFKFFDLDEYGDSLTLKKHKKYDYVS